MARDIDRRDFLTLAGTAAGAAAVAGCSGGEGTPTGDDGSGGGDGDDGDDGGTDTGTPLPEPETRVGYLERANRVLNEEVPWIYLNRQYSVYGKSADVNWEARRDERIDGYAIEPTGDRDSVQITQSAMDSGLDPHDHRETPTDNIVLQAYEGLLSRDREGKVVQELATGYERLEPGRVRFDLRSGVSFHSGDSLTKEDVAFSINRIVDPEVGGLDSPQSDQLAGVTGAEPADGDSAVVVESEGINPVVFALFATYCDVMNRSWVEDNDEAYINSHMNGTGPFQLAEYEQDVSVTYEAYGDYWKDGAPADELVITAASEASTRVNQLVSGETDVIVNVPPQNISQVDGADNAEISPVPSTRVIYNAMIYDREPFDSVQFRRAMNYAVDLESIIESVLSGFADATSQPTLEGFTGYNSDLDPYPYDPEEAERLVEESGYAGAEIELHTPNGRYLKDLEIAQAVVGYIDELENVSASVNQRDFGNLTDVLLDGDITTGPAFYLIGWGNATFDASQTLIPLLTSDGSLTSYKNDRVDELIDQAQSMGGGEPGTDS
ncbi:twin-arginine translocation signal domain-containing protein [Halosimplex rubrum]|uniref:Twin-arginine translocation signal domain-containing protein n=1 Tax=Halosimplex rubrum TaxID=869889 RepID=A0A7D5PB64_9EURY|nr:ABC transporter substrate-binding protein [Halosimplex rubrum]QLH78139.1 twin-arginine translocation signal domain-containing protein [Halosimplex rubrum]